MSEAEREAAVEARKLRGYPWHQPPHPETEAPAYRMVSAACFEHEPRLNTPERVGWFEEELVGLLRDLDVTCSAWCVLPNHYHALVLIANFRAFSKELGTLHGRTAYQLNTEDNARGRRVWFRSQDRCMRSQRHFHTTLNYIHNNPVHHKWARKWQDWPFSSVHWYLETMGRDWLLQIWKEYPLRDYGKKWDVH